MAPPPAAAAGLRPCCRPRFTSAHRRLRRSRPTSCERPPRWSSRDCRCGCRFDLLRVRTGLLLCTAAVARWPRWLGGREGDCRFLEVFRVVVLLFLYVGGGGGLVADQGFVVPEKVRGCCRYVGLVPTPMPGFPLSQPALEPVSVTTVKQRLRGLCKYVRGENLHQNGFPARNSRRQPQVVLSVTSCPAHITNYLHHRDQPTLPPHPDPVFASLRSARRAETLCRRCCPSLGPRGPRGFSSGERSS